MDIVAFTDTDRHVRFASLQMDKSTNSTLIQCFQAARIPAKLNSAGAESIHLNLLLDSGPIFGDITTPISCYGISFSIIAPF